jgi:hypothetical protein
MTRDRLLALIDPASGRNGIDFITVDPATSPPQLVVHFHTGVALQNDPVTVRLDGGDRIPVVPLDPVAAGDWSQVDGKLQLRLRPRVMGDFSVYTLRITAPRLDPRFASAEVSFRQFCPDPFDCAPLPPDCPPEDVAAPAIDYLAKDFASFRRLLLADSAQRYPGWVERSKADMLVMFAEALAAMADELSYQQDRLSADLNFATAISRQALTAHARLVDYEPAPLRSATCELMLNVTGTAIPAGARVEGLDGDGQRIGFEIGTGLSDTASYAVDPKANWPLAPWWWDDEEKCLPRGATQMWLEGDDLGLVAGARVLIQTDLNGESLRQIVTLTEVAADFDPLFPAGVGTALTRIAWDEAEALQRDRDLEKTKVGGNILPATQGDRHARRFGLPPLAHPDAQAAILREGTNGREVARLPLPLHPLAWLPGALTPEITVRQTDPEPLDWRYVRTLLDADRVTPAFVVDQQAWRAVSFAGEGTPRHWEPDGDAGACVRFGDGEFGQPPAPGVLLTVTWRTSAGAIGNLPADAINEIPDPAFFTAARNPLPATGGADAETAQQVRRFAPQAFRKRPLRVVRPEDYDAAARELAWVQDAGTAARWTGSWHTRFTAADPLGGFGMSEGQHLELQQLIDRRRLAGVEAYVPRPVYVAIDLEIEVCVAANARRDVVERAVLAALGPAGGGGGEKGFFFADRFTFGTPLYRARLEAAVDAVPGVKGVLALRYRRRGALSGFTDLPPRVMLGMGEILRIDNDPSWPERGTIRIITEGGA